MIDSSIIFLGRDPIKSPTALADQITSVETKIQQILARIPNTGDFVTILKEQMKNGQIGKDDEFLRMQRGLHHVSARMEEIDDFRDFWTTHKDLFKRWVKKKNQPLNVKPADIAHMGFFSFIQSPIGHSLYKVCLLNGWPTTEEWKKWEAWWNIQHQKITDMENHTGTKVSTASWPIQVSSTADMINNLITDVISAAAENMAQLNIEKILWKTVLIQNLLTEIGIFPQAQEKSWFAELWNFNVQILKTKPTIHNLHKLLTNILPNKNKPDHILYASTPFKDWIMHRDHQCDSLMTTAAVPRIRNLPEAYRLALEKSADLHKKEKTQVSTKNSPKRKSNDKISPKRVKIRKIKREPSPEYVSTSDVTSSEDETSKNVYTVSSSSEED